MKILKFTYLVIIQLIICITINTNLSAKTSEYFQKGDKISSYFSGILSLYDHQYDNTYKFFKKLDGLEKSHSQYSQLYLYSLINLRKFEESFRYSKKLERLRMDNFDSNLIIIIYYLKKNQFDDAQKYIIKLDNKKIITPLQTLIIQSISSWLNFEMNKQSSPKKDFEFIEPRFKNIKKIQDLFLSCYLNSSDVEDKFKDLINDNRTDFTRYYFFYSNYLSSKQKFKEANKIIDESLIKSPRNLLLNQLKYDLLADKKFKNKFDCKNLKHVIAELFYIASNALSSQSIYSASNFYLSLAMFLNEEFISYKTLYAENIYMIDNLNKSRKIYEDIKKSGGAYEWYAVKQITTILFKQNKDDKAIKYFSNNFKKIDDPNIYQTFDYAEFLKNNKKFNDAIKYYSNILELIDKNHKLYSKVTDGRGISYERIDEWEKAEVDFLNSLDVEPDQAYVINYLAYSWIEKGINIKRSLQMLRKANDLKKNDGYIVDSLGWALFKLNQFNEAERYLKQAVSLMPTDPIVNDHFGDLLWKMGKDIRARYYWNHVLRLETTEKELKNKVKDKIIFGL